MSKKISGREAAIEVLREMGGRGPVKDVCAEAAKRAKLNGPTPNATVASMMYQKAKKGQTFRIVERGVVELVEATEQPAPEPIEELGPAVTPGSVVVKEGEVKPDPKPQPTAKKQRRSRKPKAAATA